MMIKKMIAIVLAAVMLLSAAGCGAKTEKPQNETAETETTTEQSESTEAEPAEQTAEAPAQKAQNPILDYAGAYSDENGAQVYLLFEAWDEENSVNIQTAYSGEETYTYWEMIGRIEGNTVTYENGCKYSIDRSTAEEETIYEDGTGTFTISADKKVTWKDDKEDAGKDVVFAWDEELNQQLRDQMEGTFQNPIMNWAGGYADKNNKSRTMTIESGSEDQSDGTITVKESTGLEQMTTWTMGVLFNEEAASMDYSSCVKKVIALDADGKPVSEETLYEDGTGSFAINTEDQTITWIDDKENAGEGSLFVFRYEYGETGEDDGATDEAAEEAP